MSEPASISSGIALRYATALFELAKEANQISAIENDAEALSAALADSPDFRELIASPVYSRADQGKAVDAVAAAMGLSTLSRNTLALMATRRRLFVLRQFVAALRERIAVEKGEVTAEVASAKALTPAQSEALASSLSASVGKTVKLHTTVDEGLIGGLVVKVGSKMIDTSIRSRLAALQNVMKEVG
ncbi:F0F1 ATP synthase subunit delta [Halodurantibacterium flavum]|uniref:ATP synthase subunit delta n=1 Tax=Halodurantibacterium flavum TaxID=1382802 RepID=A0ABW4S2K5_9RHOB